MLNFKQYLKTFSKKFVFLWVDPTTQSNLVKYCVDNGFDLTKDYDGNTQKPENFHFHLTIYYTHTYHKTPSEQISVEPFKLEPVKFELLGKNNDVPVLKIKPSKPLLEIRNKFYEQGFRDSWPSYLPHISLSYNYNGTPDISNLKLPDFDIIAGKIEIEDQD